MIVDERLLRYVASGQPHDRCDITCAEVLALLNLVEGFRAQINVERAATVRFLKACDMKLAEAIEQGQHLAAVGK